MSGYKKNYIPVETLYADDLITIKIKGKGPIKITASKEHPCRIFIGEIKKK